MSSYRYVGIFLVLCGFSVYGEKIYDADEIRPFEQQIDLKREESSSEKTCTYQQDDDDAELCCYCVPPDEDPLEDWNRAMLHVNEGLDTLIFGPVIDSYRNLTPPVLQTGVKNVLYNIATPVTVLNYLFQGNPRDAGIALGRFVINSILGLGGLFDVATELDVTVPYTDFGETIRLWGGGTGLFVVWPILGPSMARDSCGMWVDFFLNPLNMWATLAGQDKLLLIYGTAYTFQQKNDYFDLLNDLNETSVDYYSALRSLYLQKRDPKTEEEENQEEDGPRPLEN